MAKKWDHGFLSGSFLIGYPASLAAMSLIFAKFAGTAFGWGEGSGRAVALIGLATLLLLHHRPGRRVAQ